MPILQENPCQQPKISNLILDRLYNLAGKAKEVSMQIVETLSCVCREEGKCELDPKQTNMSYPEFFEDMNTNIREIEDAVLMIEDILNRCEL